MVSSTDGPYKVHMKSFRGYLCKQNFRIGHLKQCRRTDFNIVSYVAIKEPSKDGTFRYCVRLINSKIFLLIAYRKIPNVRPGLIDIRKYFFFLFLEGAYIMRAFQLESSKHYNLRRNDGKMSLPSRRLSKWGTNTPRYQGAIIHNSLVDLSLHNITSKPVV